MYHIEITKGNMACGLNFMVHLVLKVPVGSYRIHPYPVLLFGDMIKAGYPNKGVWYEPTGSKVFVIYEK